MKSGLYVLTLASLSLAGCVSEKQVNVSQNVVQVNGANGAAARPAPAPAAVPSGPQTVSKTVLSGVATNLNFSFSLNPDCTVRDVPTVRILQQPSHGTVEVSQGEDYPAFPPNNTHFACNKNKTKGTSLAYTPTPAYTGPDFLVFEVISSSGSDNTYRVQLAVK